MSVIFKINDVDVTNQINLASIKINDNINDKVNTLDFYTEKYGDSGFKPADNASVEITQDGVVIFGGVIITCSEQIIGSRMLRYDCKATDYSRFLDRKLVTERYENVEVGAMVTDIIDTYASDFTSMVTSSVPIGSMSFNRLTVSQCLQKIANALNFVWWVDYEKNLYMVKKNEESAPFGLSDESENHIWDSLVIEKDVSQIRNEILIEGGDEITLPQTVKYHGDGSQTDFDTIYKFSNLPTVVVDGVTQTVGVDNIGDEGDYDFMWSFNEKYVRAVTTPPSYADPDLDEPNVLITGTPLFPILVRVPDPVSIGKYGRFEYAIKDTNITSTQEGIDRAVAELKAYAGKISEGSFETYRGGLKSGQTINIQSELRDMNENFIIQKVSTRFITVENAENEDGNENYIALYDVSLATLKTVGIIDILQKLLLDEEVSEGERDVLLTYLQFEDTFGFTDEAAIITTQTPPYVWDDGTGTVSDARWNYSTWGS